MKIALIGAGFTGMPVLAEALDRGHEITLILRDPSKVTEASPKLIVSAADVNNTDILTGLLEGHDAVISTFNPGWNSPDLYVNFIKGSENIQQAIKTAGIKRFIVIGGSGSLEVTPGVQLVDTPDFPDKWKEGATAARDYLKTLRRETWLDWTYLSPAINLYPGTRTGSYRTGMETPVYDDQGRSEISNGDLAVAVLDELDRSAFIKKRFTAGY